MPAHYDFMHACQSIYIDWVGSLNASDMNERVVETHLQINPSRQYYQQPISFHVIIIQNQIPSGEKITYHYCLIYDTANK